MAVAGQSESRLLFESAPLWQLPNYMATTLAPVDSREVVRCDHCHLVQFRTNNNNCRRCRTSLDNEPEPVIAVPEVIPQGGIHNDSSTPQIQIALAIRSLRHRSGLSQRQLAGRMQVPRTYVSKIENEKATPTLSSLARLAAALEVTIPDLLRGDGRAREDEIAALATDPFVAEVAPYIFTLDPMQRSSLMMQMRDLATRPRRKI
jgi:transcriptional regulator with XRE-family HTH domain